MGDIADAMLDGTLCSQCGEFVGDTDAGVPVLCDYCSTEDGRHGVPRAHVGRSGKRECPICGKRRKGLEQHIRDCHRGDPLALFRAVAEYDGDDQILRNIAAGVRDGLAKARERSAQ